MMKPRRRVMSRAEMLARIAPPPARTAASVVTQMLSALHELATGAAPREEDWRDIADAVNTLETLTLHQKVLDPAEVVPVLRAATEAMKGAATRPAAAWRWLVPTCRRCETSLTSIDSASKGSQSGR